MGFSRKQASVTFFHCFLGGGGGGGLGGGWGSVPTERILKNTSGGYKGETDFLCQHTGPPL